MCLKQNKKKGWERDTESEREEEKKKKETKQLKKKSLQIPGLTLEDSEGLCWILDIYI